MAASATAWRVLEHGPIERLDDRVWWVQGALPGMSLKRVMTAVRLQSGSLAIHGAIALREPEQLQLEAWGKPELLIVPSGIHRLDAPRYKQRYPGLRVLAPHGSRDKVAEVVPVDGTYEDFTGDGVLELRSLPGLAEREGVMLVRSDAGVSLVFNDVVMNMDTKRALKCSGSLKFGCKRGVVVVGDRVVCLQTRRSLGGRAPAGATSGSARAPSGTWCRRCRTEALRGESLR